MHRTILSLRYWLPVTFALCFALAARAQFTTIINVPPNIGGNQSVGSDTQVNMTSGSIGFSFNAGNANGTSTNVEVNVSGGALGFFFAANAGSTVNLTGGLDSGDFLAKNGSAVNISGGSMGNGFTADSGSAVTIAGGEFFLDDVPIAGLETVDSVVPLNVPPGAVLSGTLPDGRLAVFSSQDRDTFANGVLSLRAAATPAVGPATINLPGGPAPLALRNGQTLHLAAGGVVPDYFSAGGGSSVVMTGGQIGSHFEAVGANIDISGGNVGFLFNAFTGTTVNVSGGNFSMLDAFRASVMNISGGTFSPGLRAAADSAVTLSGGEFRLDGVPIAGLETAGNVVQLNLTPQSVLSGTLENGTPFAFFGNSTVVPNDLFADGTLTLRAAALPPPAGSVINLPADPVPTGLREGQTLNFGNGATLPGHFTAAWGSRIVWTGNQSGGGGALKAVAATFDMHSGSVGSNVHMYLGSVANIHGGTVGGGIFSIQDGSQFNVFNGAVTAAVTAADASSVNIHGGTVNSVTARFGSSINIDGGKVTGTLDVRDGSVVNVHSVTSIFRLQAFSSAVNLHSGSYGSAFIANNSTVTMLGGEFSSFADVANKSVFNMYAGNVGSFFDVFGNSIANIYGGTIGNFASVRTGGVLNLYGGTIGSSLDVNGGTVNFLGATSTDSIQVENGVVNLHQGTLGTFFYVKNGGVLNVSGGAMGNLLDVLQGGVLNMAGGSIGFPIDAQSGSVLNLSGGTHGGIIQSQPSSIVNLFGSAFVLNGADVTSTLMPDEPFTIADRNVLLTAVLADGSPFRYELHSTFVEGRDYLAPGATLTITLVSGIPGDFNDDDTVNAADYTVWRNALGTDVAIRGKAGDGNFDGRVTQADYFVWKKHYGESGGGLGASFDELFPFAVPEPVGLLPLMIAATIGLSSRRRPMYSSRSVRRMLTATAAR